LIIFAIILILLIDITCHYFAIAIIDDISIDFIFDDTPLPFRYLMPIIDAFAIAIIIDAIIISMMMPFSDIIIISLLMPLILLFHYCHY
jgi:hypothetical protein